MSDNDEVERLRRLRDGQVSKRDARAANDRRRAKAMASKPRAKFSISEEIKKMPAKYTWPVVGAPLGFVFGLIIGLLLDITFNIKATELAALLLAFIGAFIAFMLGRIRDSGTEDWG